MNTTTRRTRLVTAVLLAASVAIATPALTGCGAIRDAVEQATGGDVDFGGNTVPEDFPTEVPLIEGEVLAGGSVGNEDGKIWNVTIKVDDGSAFDEISAQLEAAGFVGSEMGGRRSRQHGHLHQGAVRGLRRRAAGETAKRGGSPTTR